MTTAPSDAALDRPKRANLAAVAAGHIAGAAGGRVSTTTTGADAPTPTSKHASASSLPDAARSTARIRNPVQLYFSPEEVRTFRVVAAELGETMSDIGRFGVRRYLEARLTDGATSEHARAAIRRFLDATMGAP